MAIRLFCVALAGTAIGLAGCPASGPATSEQASNNTANNAPQSTDRTGGPAAVEAPDWRDLPRARFAWRGLWTWLSADADAATIEQTVAMADEAGFNVLLVNVTAGGRACYDSRLLPVPDTRPADPLAEVIRRAHARDMRVYAWATYLHNWPAADGPDGPEGTTQVVLPDEDEAARQKLRNNPDRVDVQGGVWLCPDQGLSDFERGITDELADGYDLDGLAIDFLGYRNYRACYCDVSVAQREAFAAAHPELDAEEVIRRHGAASLVRFSEQVADAVHHRKPEMKIACHVYPDFDPDPLYASQLDVDYCGETIAWFYKPHWPLATVRERHERRMALPRRKGNLYVPFIGCRGGKLMKSPDRLRTELRLAGTRGCDRLMFAFSFTLDEEPGLAALLGEELTGGRASVQQRP